MSFTKVLRRGLENLTAGTILGRNTGTGEPEALSVIPVGVDVPAARLSGDIAPARVTTALNASGDAPVFACRAWVNFDGTRNVTNTGASTNGQPVFIRASGNVTSVVRNGVGDYTVNFTTAMPDANFAAVASHRKPDLYEGQYQTQIRTYNQPIQRQRHRRGVF